MCSSDLKKEIYKNLANASAFISHQLQSSNHVWIAQRQGRAKDGFDKTDSAVLKMIHMNQRKLYPFEELTKNINLVPVSISYEIDPLAPEKAIKMISGSNEKVSDEDVSHIFKGIMLNKGRVHLSFCPQINEDLSSEDLAQAIDVHIKNNYKIWDTNRYAYHFLKGDTDEANKYTRGLNYFDNLRVSMTNQELEYIMLQYANPLKFLEDK